MLKQGHLIVTNDSRRAEEATLRFPGLTTADARSLTDPTGATLLIRDGEVKLTMPPFGIAVYELVVP